MFAVIYTFQVKKNQEKIFEKAWSDLTKLIYLHEGSLGSRLHKQDDGSYLAYAQWPSKEKWIKEWKNLPEKAEEISKIMYDSCEEIETLFELDLVSDLLKTETNK